METTNEMTNFMGGKSFKLFNPLNRLKLVAFSSFLGEPTYYQPVEREEAYIEEYRIQKKQKEDNLLKILKDHLLIPTDMGVSRNQTFYNATMEALDYDFGKTLKLAIQCRIEFMMRRSTSQILAIAASHPKRVEFNEQNPKMFREVLVKCWNIPGDAIACLDAWKSMFGSKTKLPSFLKRAFEDRLGELSPYQQEKYRRESIDMVRLSHPSKATLKKNDTLSILMKNGHLELDEKDIKWEKHRSLGKSWLETLEAMEWNMPHMAALRNICGFAESNPGMENIVKYMEMLLNGVKGGKQFPFRYITAYEQIQKKFKENIIKNFKNIKMLLNGVKADRKEDINEDEDIEIYEEIEIEENEDIEVDEEIKLDVKEESKNNKKREKKPPVIISNEYKDVIIEYLEKCIQSSIENYPVLQGDVISLSDNSGSARGTMTSTYGTQTISNIGNLSALFTAYRATGRGVVGVFGDDLKFYEVNKYKSLLEQYNEINALGNKVGGGTETGVWLFFKWAFQNPSENKYDHWFCYSDMQVGHGGLYGNDHDISKGFQWTSPIISRSHFYIDIHKCVDKYRMEINPKLNTYMVQTAGYDNSILPETTYRGAILSGWTGNEVVYAKELCRLWDEIENI